MLSLLKTYTEAKDFNIDTFTHIHTLIHTLSDTFHILLAIFAKFTQI